MKRTPVFLLIMVLVLGVAVTANAKKMKIYVQQDKYAPNMGNTLNVYKDKTIFLANFENQAENTSIWYYYGKNSKGKKIYYEAAPTLQSYLWYCWEKALLAGGMAVHRDTNPKPQEVPELRITFTSWSDLNFDCEVTVLKANQQLLRKKYTITFDPAEDPDDEAKLEQRAYQSMDKIITSIMGDPELQNAVLGK